MNSNTPYFDTTEHSLSQKPALELLSKLGWEIVDYEQANKLRGEKLSSVLLEDVLYKQLSKINKISFQGKEYAFEPSCIQSAVQKLKPFKNDGLLPLNSELTDLLIIGTSETQSINGFTKSFSLNYIDWNNPENNIFYAVPEFIVERVRSVKTVRPDIVLFVNGIPLCVIECKAPSEELEQAVTQNIRNQTESYIPHLFMYCQILMAVNKNGAKYATVGSQSKFWNVWKESDLSELLKIEKNPTEQDKAIYSLCSKNRFLDLIHGYTVFDVGTKKIARYQQYFSIKSTLERIHCVSSDGIRQGGIIWHTQGSGKSLTMVMLAKNLMYCNDITAPRIILVTDRTDLDEQLGDTFKHCGITPVRATSGKNLLDLVSEKKASVITTLIHKFDKAAGVRKFQDDSSDIFVLVDESHRTQFGSFAAKMRQMFPKACYIGFTGTPLLKKEKNNFQRFGGLIRPTYTISQAVVDKAVVPLLYEGRLVELTQNKEAIDLWFERHTKDLNDEQKADLKKKYARADMLQKTEQVIYMRAFDINEHYKNNWQGTGFKGQLVAADKKTAVKFKQFFDEFGDVSTEVLISGVDTRDSYTDILEDPSEIVDAFWKKMMAKYKDEKEYNEKIIDAFKHG
ncbi:MAG: HsdR family type I site-specific deoxyribonuclease, partial [Treponema sp.]|nr:HsdR family type I site-specific deoxyribonuclease [Treponema sp.]